MKQRQHVCKNCVLIDGSFGIGLNSEGICNYCEDPTYKTANWWKTQITDERKEAGLKDWNSVIGALKKEEIRIRIQPKRGSDIPYKDYKIVYGQIFNKLDKALKIE